MLEFLPREVRDGLLAAGSRRQKRRSRLRVQLGEAVFPILRFWDGGLALDAGRAAHLRGLVDIHDGARQVFQCLIVASAVQDGELICTFKRLTAVTGTAALDYCRDENAPSGYLTRN